MAKPDQERALELELMRREDVPELSSASMLGYSIPSFHCCTISAGHRFVGPRSAGKWVTLTADHQGSWQPSCHQKHAGYRLTKLSIYLFVREDIACKPLTPSHLV